MNGQRGMGAYNVQAPGLPQQQFLDPQSMGMLMNIFKQRQAPHPSFQTNQTQDPNAGSQPQQPGYGLGQNLAGMGTDGQPQYAGSPSTGLQPDPNQMAQSPSPLLQALMRQRPQGSY